MLMSWRNDDEGQHHVYSSVCADGSGSCGLDLPDLGMVRCEKGEVKMADLKRWLKKVWCWLSGGHTYADINLETHRVPEHRMTCFRNKCLKCGESYVFAVNDEALYSTYPLPNRLEIEFDYEAED